MSEGGKPGITAKVTVGAVFSDAVVFTFSNKEDFEYFQGKQGQEFMANFVPVEAKKDGE